MFMMHTHFAPARVNGLLKAAEDAARAVPPAFPLTATVAVNPFLGQAGNDLATTAALLARVAGTRVSLPRGAYAAKLRNGETGELLAEYADSQKDKMSLLSFRDYSANAHSRRASQDWARQMEQLASTPASHKVPGAMRLTLNPF